MAAASSQEAFLMASTMDYLFWRGDLPFSRDPFNDVDGMILARLSYAPFELLPAPDGPRPLREAAGEILALPDLDRAVRMPEDRDLLAALADSPRFRDLTFLAFENRLDAGSATQFSAVALRLEEGLCCVAFRGTDNTLVGWKEDLNMGFQCPVPAQRLAVEYLERIGREIGDDLVLTGHSKGGNLAVYAAAFCSPALQDRIRAVRNYDGPGFDDAVLASEGYRRICDRVETFVPQSSIVGMLLGHREKYTVVHSTRAAMPQQHNTYSWEIERTGFLCLETVTGGSRFVDSTLKEWITHLNAEQWELFVDTVYQVLTETNAQTVRELSEKRLTSAWAVLKSVKRLDDETRRVVTETLKSLARCARQELAETARRHGSRTPGM